MKKACTAEELGALMEQFDTDGNGTLEFEEFEAAAATFLTQHAALPEEEEEEEQEQEEKEQEVMSWSDLPTATSVQSTWCGRDLTFGGRLLGLAYRLRCPPQA
jgi:hypothetical protein